MSECVLAGRPEVVVAHAALQSQLERKKERTPLATSPAGHESKEERDVHHLSHGQKLVSSLAAP